MINETRFALVHRGRRRPRCQPRNCRRLRWNSARISDKTAIMRSPPAAAALSSVIRTPGQVSAATPSSGEPRLPSVVARARVPAADRACRRFPYQHDRYWPASSKRGARIARRWPRGSRACRSVISASMRGATPNSVKTELFGSLKLDTAAA
jgi:hypothetical protein